MQPEFNVTREKSGKLYAARTDTPSCRLHFHSNIELLLVQEGQVEAWVNDRHSILQAGELLVALSYDAHRYHNLGRVKAICMIIPTEMCPEFIAAVGEKAMGIPFIRDQKLFALLCDCFDRLKAAEHPLVVRGYLAVILGSLLGHMEPAQRQENQEIWLFREVLLYINEHFAEDISLASVAAAMGYNSSYLSRAFRKSFHMGVSEYITMTRLRQAVLLMKEGRQSITECAYESGFRSLRTFYRVFEKEFGCTPRKYIE